MIRKEVVQPIQIGRIKQAQEKKVWIASEKEYMVEDVTQMNVEDAKKCSRITPYSDMDENRLLFLSPIVWII